MKHDDDMERDQHLQQALKHAPDAALSAPPQVSARIIEAARDAVADRQQAARRKPGWWAAWLQPRPGSWTRTGAFATVLMAVLLTLMWPAQTPGPATDSETTVAEAPAPAPAPTRESAPPAAAPAAAPQPAAPQALAAPAAPAVAEPGRKRDVPKPAPSPAPADIRSAAAPPPPTAPAPVANAAEVAPVEPAPGVATAHAPPAAAKAAGTVTAARARADAMPALNTPSLQAGLAPTAPSSLAAWLQRQPPNLAWRIDGAPPVGASLPWLQRLASSTGSRWRPIGGAASRPGATTLQLLSAGGDPVAQLVLHADHVLWCDMAGACSRSLLTPEVMDMLQKELPR